MTILRLEFDVALRKLKTNKVQEIDYIPAELFQNSYQIVVDALYDLSRDIYEKGEVLDVYCNSIILIILKKQIDNICD